MGRVKKEIKTYEIKDFLRGAMYLHLRRALKQSPRTEQKPWAIESDDWDRAFNTFPWNGWFSGAIPKWRKYRHYKTRRARDMALIDLNKKYRYVCKFRAPPNEDKYLNLTPKRIQEAESIFCKYLRRIFREKKND